jgi:uncharacterized protein YkwD
VSHLRLSATLFLVMVASTLVAVGVGSPADAVTPHVYRHVAARNVDDVRTDRDLRALKPGSCLDTFAQRQARRMARKKEIYHQRLETVQSRCGMTYVGETVVSGFRSARDAVRRGLMRSDAHRAILLDAPSRRMGVGAKKRGRTWYLCVLVAHK